MAEDPAMPSTPASSPGEVPPAGPRRLERPPSERYRDTEGAATELRGGSLRRAIALAVPPAFAGAAAFTALAGPLAVDAGLVIVCGAMGLAIGRAVWLGGGTVVSGGRRVGVAVLIFVLALVGAELATWQFALAEGGVLGPVDYLGQTFGGLVVLEFLAGLVGAVIAAA